MRLLCCVLLFLTASSAPAQESTDRYFDFSGDARLAYEQIFSLRFQEAQQTLIRLKVEQPHNQIYFLLRNYIDCLTLFIGENTTTYQRLRRNKELRLDQLRQGDRSSPYYLYAQADIYLQWAITRVKFSEYFQAVMEIKRAFHLLERNRRLFPDFMPNQKNLGLMHALIGTVPDAYKWGVQILGMNGTIDQGKAEIEAVLAHADQEDFVFEQETRVMYAYLLLHLENNKERAWEVMESAQVDPTTNPLGCFVKANIAMQTRRNDLAIALLEARPAGDAFFSFPYLEFMLGVAKLNRLDEAAADHLQSYLEQTKGLHYIKEAYQKLAWNACIHGRDADYHRYMEACLKLGQARVDEDIAALEEARQDALPQRDLLKARVLSDGGYHNQAAQLLRTLDNDEFVHAKHRIEYHYRLGRIHHALGLTDEALADYRQTLATGGGEPYYFACNAAVLSGNLYEELDMKEEAIASYRQALTLRPEEYRLSLHQKAKAGLNRLGAR
ncbi:MAG: hypothetical protein KTR24_05625 [Saprospiraceae bacterium]|nr:hypothetical protein [Saprospiraceae bacterium]